MVNLASNKCMALTSLYWGNKVGHSPSYIDGVESVMSRFY